MSSAMERKPPAARMVCLSTTMTGLTRSICQFAEFDKSLGCGGDKDGVHHYCIPRIFKPRPSRLFHNNSNGTFTDVSTASGIAEHLGKAWGVVATDVNNAGRMDLFPANDTVANFLFMKHGGRFEEVGLAADVARTGEHVPA